VRASAEVVRLFLEKRRSGVAALRARPDPALRAGYLKAAAVLDAFDPTALVALDGRSGEAAACLADDMVSVPSVSETGEYTLMPQSRAEGLASLSDRAGMLAARACNPAQGSADRQWAIDAVIGGDTIDLEALSEEQLTALLQAVRWFVAVLPGLPAEEAVRRHLLRKRLVSRFDRLANGFFGRKEELRNLREFVGVLEPTTTADAVRRRILPRNAPLLMLYGMGGIGKSSLLAEFILQHARSRLPFPFVYLDFDNHFLDPEDITTLVEESLSQLEAQYPEASATWAAMRDNLPNYSAQLQESEIDTADTARSLSIGETVVMTGTQQQVEETLASDFASFLSSGLRSNILSQSSDASQDLPFVLVIDTFEEVQKRSETSAGLWRFLVRLRREFPRTRVIVSGRAALRGLEDYGLTGVDALEVPEFDSEAGVAILTRLGVTEPGVALALYKQVGGNPLSLRLAARVYHDGGAGVKGVEGLKTSSYLFFSASESVIQGQLYTRILDHIHDPDVRKLAHPGLVVRRITPDVILRVLSEPCGLRAVDEKSAADLFNRLRNQVDLVTIESDGSLSHRSDVRKVMLRLLAQDRPDQVRAIHTAAVAYYHDQPGAAARIEEIYHQMQLGADRAQLDAIWDSTVGKAIEDAKDELPASAQVYLASKTKIDLAPEIRAQADLEAWEALTEPKVRDLIRRGGITTALSMLRERKERTLGSVLYGLEAALLILSQQYAQAEILLNIGIESAEASLRTYHLLEMVRIRGDLLAQTGRGPEAESEYERAEKLAAQLGNAALQLQIYVQRIKLHQTGTGAAPETTPDSTRYLQGILDRLDEAEMLKIHSQLVGLFRMCGPHHRGLLSKGLGTFNLSALGAAQIPPFPSVTATRLSETLEGDALARGIASEFGVPVPERSPLVAVIAPWDQIVGAARARGRLNEMIQRVLDASPDEKPLAFWTAQIIEAAIAPVLQAAPLMAGAAS
jgi:cellulose synthase operon protein C